MHCRLHSARHTTGRPYGGRPEQLKLEARLLTGKTYAQSEGDISILPARVASESGYRPNNVNPRECFARLRSTRKLSPNFARQQSCDHRIRNRNLVNTASLQLGKEAR